MASDFTFQSSFASGSNASLELVRGGVARFCRSRCHTLTQCDYTGFPERLAQSHGEFQTLNNTTISSLKRAQAELDAAVVREREKAETRKSENKAKTADAENFVSAFKLQYQDVEIDG